MSTATVLPDSARCAWAQDVQTVIGVARGVDAPVSVCSGGNDPSGRCLAEDSVVIDPLNPARSLRHEAHEQRVVSEVVAFGAGTDRAGFRLLGFPA